MKKTKNQTQQPKNQTAPKSTFEKNLEALLRVDPILAHKLAAVTPNKNYEVFTSDDPLNINIINKSNHAPIYAGKPIDETHAKLAELSKFAHYPYLYFFGAGNGVLFKILLDNAILKRLLVIEPEVEILFIVLNLLDFSADIAKNRVIFLDLERANYSMIDSFFSMNKEARVYGKIYELLITCEFYWAWSEAIVALNRHFVSAIEHAVISVGNDTKDSIIGLTQHLNNLPDAIKTPSLLELIARLKERVAESDGTAVIVATGPSLSKQLPLLKQIAPFVTIMCIDASLPILARQGIKPDVVLSLERVEPTAKFYEETADADKKGVIFAITSIVHARLKKALEMESTRGQVTYSFRPFGYTSYFGAREYGYLGIGMSAANMAYELVVHSRFKRLIIIGQDLAFGKDGTSHASNAVYGANEIKPKTGAEKLFVPAWGGEGEVETTRVWKLFKQFYERDIALTPYKIDVVNATEGGARIDGTREITFKEAAALVEKTHEKKPLVLTPPDSAQIAKNRAEIRKNLDAMITYGAAKKKKVERVFLKVAAACEDLAEKNRAGELEKIDFRGLEKLAKEVDKVKAFLGEREFFSCFNDAVQSYIFHQEMDIARVVTRSVNDKMEAKAKLVELIFAHKYWLFSLAGGMDCVLEIAKKTKREWDGIFDSVK